MSKNKNHCKESKYQINYQNILSINNIIKGK